MMLLSFTLSLLLFCMRLMIIFLSPAQCPPDWLADGRSCYTVRRTGLTWSDAQHRCRGLAAGSHLADLKTLEDLLFISSHLRSHNKLLLLWTGLNDLQVTF
uniref:C-type lectin domain-containing protein n=1 Tax=Sander lucioperca TaxID=283035 RepID=A0A8C9WZL3_SANLU